MTASEPPASHGQSEKQILTLEQAFARALKFHQSGQLSEAETLYHEILKADPDHFNALHLLGLIAHHTGDNVAAAELITRATVLQPAFALAFMNLGNVLLALGRNPEAIAKYQQSLAIDPNPAEIHFNLGNAYAVQERYDEAMTSYLQALEINPAYINAYTNLGNAYEVLGQIELARGCYGKVLELGPRHPDAAYNLANILHKLGQTDAAISNYHLALELDPESFKALSNLGNAYAELGMQGKAIETYNRAFELNPTSDAILSNLANALQNAGQFEQAMEVYHQTLKMNPKNAKAHSNLLLLMGYYPGVSGPEIRAEAERWDRQHRHPGTHPGHGNEPDPNRPLRIGFVSGDLRDHPVTRFLLGYLGKIDASQMQLLAYHNSYKQDDLTERLKQILPQWRNVAQMSDGELVDQIRRDSIDLLIDLSGHTALNRLPMFTRKPAPVQVTWLGYGGTTGMESMDYILADAHVLPPEDESHFSESPWRLPNSSVCYTPPEIDLPCGPLPALTNGYVTFASFNNLVKITDPTVECWAAILNKMPDSRLILKALQLKDETVREETFSRFEDQGIPRDRLTLKNRTRRQIDHFADYQKIDMALDPFPYSGQTTTVEAYWMGTPVLTLRGDRFVSRMGESLSHNIGLDDWLATSRDDYVDRALMHASNLQKLADLRENLRQQFLASPLCDAARFARNMETAWRGMWQNWCKNQNT